MKKSTLCAFVLLGGVLVSRPASASIVKDVVLTDNVAMTLELYPGVRTLIRLPSELTHYSLGNTKDFDYKRLRKGIQPLWQTGVTNLELEAQTGSASLEVVVLPAEKYSVRKLTFRPPEADSRVHGVPHRGVMDAVTLHNVLAKIGSEHFQVREPIEVDFDDGKRRLTLRIGQQFWLGDVLMFRFAVTNWSDSPYLVEGIEVFDYTHTNNHLASLDIMTGYHRLPSTLASKGGTIEGTAVLEKPKNLGNTFHFRLPTAPFVVPATFQGDWTGFKEPAKPPTRPPHYLHKLSVGPHGLIGVIQLANDAGDNDWTILRGFGVPADYAAFKNLSIEGAVDFVSTGDADLGGGTAHLTGGRLRANARLHFGDSIMPFLRAGAGVVAGSQSSGDDPEFRFGIVGSFGLGVKFWLGKSLSLGLSATALAGVLTSAEFGAHLSYAWKP